MLYLFDANVLITASSTYYPIDQVPEFWGWLHFQGHAGNIKLPLEIMEEILAGKKDDDPLLGWLKDADNKAVLLLDEAVDPDLVNTVVENGLCCRSQRRSARGNWSRPVYCCVCPVRN